MAAQEQQYLPSLDGGSVGAVAVHPTRKFLAVAEHCRYRSPNIYIYSYPDLKLRRVLQNGTERAYRCVFVCMCLWSCMCACASHQVTNPSINITYAMGHLNVTWMAWPGLASFSLGLA